MASTKRERLRKEHWPGEEDTWTGEEAGWYKIPRTFPLLFSLLTKEIRGNIDPTPVYLELLSHHYGDGFVELKHETEHAFAVGYSSGRIRSWRERMAKLAELGFIKTKSSGSQPYKYVLLIHPTTVLQGLRDDGKINDEWWNAYVSRKAETRELSFSERVKLKVALEVPTKRAKRRASPVELKLGKFPVKLGVRDKANQKRTTPKKPDVVGQKS